LGYVLCPGETVEDIPESVLEGMKKVNRLQDMTREHMKIGMTGNEILKNIHTQMEKEGIEGKIYCHATGEFGHSAGTVIGQSHLSLHSGAFKFIPKLDLALIRCSRND
jgi:hypothetical protein